MTTLAGDFDLADARLLACLAAVLFAGSAAARNVCALLVIRFFHMAAHFPRPHPARHLSCQNSLAGSLRGDIVRWPLTRPEAQSVRLGKSL